MNMVTETQFSDALSRIFLRFEETDKKIDHVERRLQASINHLGGGLDETKGKIGEMNEKLDETNGKLDSFIEETRALTIKMDERLTRLEDKTAHL